MIAICRPFDKIKDLAEVDQFGYVNLPEAYSKGSIDGSINPDVSSMNKIDDPESIIGKPADEFDAIRMQNFVRERGKKSSKSEPAPAPSGEPKSEP